ncbi:MULTISPECIES: hypothetical protein [Cyanophyceae]|uniref:hypothetical protein n=1 Tax=Cyanophyceae TaxID=3028117 RepID=UPI0016847D84|nr:hypothetical protein [Trichocoleus sp. FACHB-40]MBD2004746.1 hypothetical protein [Trichocoleus sp. FACHB-40]
MFPEFLVNSHKFSGVPVGRLFVPRSFTTTPQFLRSHTIHILDVTPYPSGTVYWFIAPVSEYLRLATLYPHHRHAAYTLYLLKSASTFFSRLKPPYLPDSNYLD